MSEGICRDTLTEIAEKRRRGQQAPKQALKQALVYALSTDGVQLMDSLPEKPVLLLIGQEDGEIDSAEVIEAALDAGRLAMELKPKFS